MCQVSRRKEDDLSIISAGFAVSLDDDLKGLCAFVLVCANPGNLGHA